ncbi:hypothetical protein [Methanothrix soehngenii]|uniref:hypothetical protein n=1 Tax=Methanothrix soehngenii TaxID=2223 RepID=UPI00300C88C9
MEIWTAHKPWFKRVGIMLSVERTNNKGEVEVAICPLCNLQVEFMGAPMVRCYTTGETYEQDEIVWTPKSRVSKRTGYDAENIRGNECRGLPAQCPSRRGGV